MKKGTVSKTPATDNKDFLLSLVIPCYNESARIELMMQGLAEFEEKWKGSYEVIIVDDGSKDDTVAKIENAIATKYDFLKDKLKIDKLPSNKGKGGALKHGVGLANGDYVLTLDADMSTKPTELINWEKKEKDLFKSSNTIYIGSRKHADGKVEALQSRKVVGGVFNAVVQLFTTLKLKDTQCGFKLYPRQAAQLLFGNMQSKGWAHDVELLYQADLNDIKIVEMPIYWVNQPESKVNVVKDSIMMFFGVLAISLRIWCYNTFVLPFRIPETATPEQRKHIIYRSIFNTIGLLLLIIMPILSFQYAITGDEHWHHDNGTNIYNYFFHGDTTAQTATSGIQYYGGLFDFLTAFVYRTFHFWNHYQTMHVMEALVGAIGIIYAGKIGKLLGGWNVALLTVIFLVLSPSWFGHNFNNPKDIPFSVGYSAGVYFILLFILSLPRPSLKHFFGLVCSIGFCMGVRIGGLLLIAYLVFFMITYALATGNIKSILTVKLIRQVIVVGILGYLIAIICWPYAHLGIISKPLEALKVMSNFFINIGMIFEGKRIFSNEVPWYYIPKYILITAPLVVLAGFALGLIKGFIQKNKQQFILFLFVLFTIVFPVGYEIYKHSSLYDGWRHFLFIYPPIAAIAALGWSLLLNMRQKAVRYVTVVLIIGGLSLPAKYVYAYHPFEAVYFNELVGGVKGAYGKYETDYYMLGIRPASEWLLQHEHIADKKTIVVTNCWNPLSEYYKPYKNITVNYARLYERYQQDWDYYIAFSRFVDLSQMNTGHWPPPDTIHTINIEGVPIACILKRKTKKDYLGFQLLKEKKIPEAKQAFLESLQAYPNNNAVWEQMANIYAQENNPDSAAYAAKKALETYPGDISMYQLLGSVYAQTGKIDEAVKLYHDLAKYNEDDSHLLLAYLYANTGNPQKALAEIDLLLEEDPYSMEGYQTGIKIAQQMKDMDKAQDYYEKAKKYLPVQDEQ